MSIDYARMQQVWPKQKAALTRARRITDREKRRTTMKQVCKDAVAEWDAIGAWPDDWAYFQRALDDELGWQGAIRIEDL